MIAHATKRAKRSVRYAVVGFGYIAQKLAIPAFDHAQRNSVVSTLVSDDPMKLRELGFQYQVERRYGYDQYDICLASGIDVVHIAHYNALHAQYAIRAARAGAHILTEKPMVCMVRECEDMIATVQRNHVKIMVAYRLHFKRANLEALRLVRVGKIGEPRFFTSGFSMQIAAGNVRNKSEMGSGSPGDLGIYCDSVARNSFSSEPIQSFAVSTHHGRWFREVDEMTRNILCFPRDRTAGFTCSFNASDTTIYRIVGTTGSIQLDSADEESGTIRLTLSAYGHGSARSFPSRDQIAPELVAFSRCILSDRDPGTEGLTDMRVIIALQQSARTAMGVRKRSGCRERKPVRPAQEMHCPTVEDVDLVLAEDHSCR